MLDLTGDEAVTAFSEAGYEQMLEVIRTSLERFRVEFDVWFSERTMHESGAVDRALARLREQGHVFDQDGAVWLRTTDFGDDKDRVLVRSNGEKTYFAADCRLLPRQARTRLRPVRLHARRRPPRLRQPAAHDRVVRGRRRESDPRGA